MQTNKMIICIKGAGEMASAVARQLYMANMRRIFMLECPRPLAVRRKVSFCEAIYEGTQEVESVQAALAANVDEIKKCWQNDLIAVTVDPAWQMLSQISATVVVDAILAKKNLGTSMDEAPLVIGLGPGFIAQQHVHLVVETQRGHDLGRIITSGSAKPNTGIPGSIEGYTLERVLRSPGVGCFRSDKQIGNRVSKGDIVGHVNDKVVRAGVHGVLRGLIRSNSDVQKGLKIGDIDPRGVKDYCHTISDKARTISGSVLGAVLRGGRSKSLAVQTQDVNRDIPR